MSTYEELVQKNDAGIYTLLLDQLKNDDLKLANAYVTSQRLDARFSFENNLNSPMAF